MKPRMRSFMVDGKRLLFYDHHPVEWVREVISLVLQKRLLIRAGVDDVIFTKDEHGFIRGGWTPCTKRLRRGQD